MLQRIIATISLASLCLLSAMLTFTTPASAGPLGLLVIFISAYLAFIGLVSFFLFGISKLISSISASMTVAKPIQQMNFKRAYYFSTVLAAAPVMLIAMQSVRSIDVYQLGLVIVFEVVACLYVSRRIK
jgi:uncharacterized membrane protein